MDNEEKVLTLFTKVGQSPNGPFPAKPNYGDVREFCRFLAGTSKAGMRALRKLLWDFRKYPSEGRVNQAVEAQFRKAWFKTGKKRKKR